MDPHQTASESPFRRHRTTTWVRYLTAVVLHHGLSSTRVADNMACLISAGDLIMT